jgi:hypothetical protein
MSIRIQVTKAAGWRRRRGWRIFEKVPERRSAHDLIQTPGFDFFKGRGCCLFFLLVKHGVAFDVWLNKIYISVPLTRSTDIKLMRQNSIAKPL